MKNPATIGPRRGGKGRRASFPTLVADYYAYGWTAFINPSATAFAVLLGTAKPSPSATSVLYPVPVVRTTAVSIPTI